MLASDQDLTPQRARAEASVKEDVRQRQKQIFGQRITALAAKHNLLTNDQLGNFLGVSGEHKPQLANLKFIADQFKVTVEFLIGLRD